MNENLKANYDLILNKAIPNKWDMLCIIWGREGSGKSTFAAQGAKYLSEQFGIKNVVFTYKQIEEGLENCEPGSSIDVDEAINVANVAQHGSKISQSIISRLTQIRKKKLKVFVCFPYLWMLNRYFISRCLFSVYVYAKDFDDRGYFKFYNANKTEEIYNYMKGAFRYNPKAALRKVKPDFSGSFSQEFPLDEKEYDEKKEKARKDNDGNPEQDMNIWKIRFLKMAAYIKENKGKVNMTELMRVTEMQSNVLYPQLKDNADIINKSLRKKSVT